MSAPWFTWANLLTLIRLGLLPLLVYTISQSFWFAAALCFTIAVITDIYDGKLARRLHQTSPFGGLFDHATDALFVTLGCWALAEAGLINIYIVALIPAAFAQYMLDSKALQGVALRMSSIGRFNGVAYYVLLGTGIGAELLSWHWLRTPVAWAAWVLVASTALSMLDRGFSLLKSKRGQSPD